MLPRRHAVEIGGADLRRIVFRVVADRLAVAVADYIGACATGARHDDLIDISAADPLDAEQRLHARVGIAGKRGACLIVRHEVAGGNKADAVFIDGIRKDVFDGVQLALLNVCEGREDDCVVFHDRRQVCEIGFRQDVEWDACRDGLALRGHDELRIGCLRLKYFAALVSEKTIATLRFVSVLTGGG